MRRLLEGDCAQRQRDGGRARYCNGQKLPCKKSEMRLWARQCLTIREFFRSAATDANRAASRSTAKSKAKRVIRLKTIFSAATAILRN